MKLYVSGPMTGYDQHNFPAFEAAATALRALGHTILSAHEIKHPEEVHGGGRLTWQQYLRGDVKEMCECDGIILLRGWNASKGARLELAVALGLELPVYYYDESCGLIDMTRST
jgi:hypothetical protein